tara:strand:- start:3643 stop:3861 length:219 start_codon:yes stop_codon:yes gene_type:complete
MTQYKNEVEKQRLLLEYEEWAEKWNHIYIEYGVLYVYYNSGRVTKDGVEIEPARPYEDNLRKMEQEYELQRR